MPGVCFYFQVHQPYRLRRYSSFDIGTSQQYFDEDANREIMRKVARKCYLPANTLMLDLLRRHEGRFKIAFSISGVCVEQMEAYAPEVLASFQQLVATGHVELLGETYHHSLASLGDAQEFRTQVAMHRRMMERVFGQTPRIFRNTELIYNDRTGELAHDLGYQGVVTEGADDVLAGRSPMLTYRHPTRPLGLLLKNYRLSDDIAFRFSDRQWVEHPLTTEKFARWLHEHGSTDVLANLFMDYETFGEHQWEESGIFDFLEHLPDAVMADPSWSFVTPSEALERHPPQKALPFPRLVSWADTERDVSAWLGNEMQEDAFRQIYALATHVKAHGDAALLDTWRKLLTSDHLYYMCTKWFADGDVHAYFSPYDSPYEAYIHFMNVLADLSGVGAAAVG